jgi:hypothetical protein
MAGVIFKPELSLGNGLTILTLLVGIAISWQQVNSRVDFVETAATELKLRVEKLAADRQDDRNALTEIRTDLRYIRQSLERLESSDEKRHGALPQP